MGASTTLVGWWTLSSACARARARGHWAAVDRRVDRRRDEGVVEREELRGSMNRVGPHNKRRRNDRDGWVDGNGWGWWIDGGWMVLC